VEGAFQLTRWFAALVLLPTVIVTKRLLQSWPVLLAVHLQVGLPARGKTFLCNKLMCYLNWWARRARVNAHCHA